MIKVHFKRNPEKPNTNIKIFYCKVGFVTYLTEFGILEAFYDIMTPFTLIFITKYPSYTSCGNVQTFIIT